MAQQQTRQWQGCLRQGTVKGGTAVNTSGGRDNEQASQGTRGAAEGHYVSLYSITRRWSLCCMRSAQIACEVGRACHFRTEADQGWLLGRISALSVSPPSVHDVRYLQEATTFQRPLPSDVLK
jgi:hypothetical protein